MHQMTGTTGAIALLAMTAFASTSWADEMTGEEMFAHLSKLARGEGRGAEAIEALTREASTIDWKGAETVTFEGNIRGFDIEGKPETSLYAIRASDGAIHVLSMPTERSAIEKGSGSPYADLKAKLGNKVRITAMLVDGDVDGVRMSFASLTAPPERLLLDRLFFIAIVVLLFLTMVGMGLTLTLKDFAIVFKKPMAMIVGPVCTFGLMPLVALALGHLFGYYETYPFVFLGLILISASPGGVTSNLMTYFGKGDVALSVSLTAVCTVLALGLTPLLLKLYGSNIPDFSIPVMEVFTSMLILVIVPLAVGMLVRWKAERLARRAEKVFAGIGIFALLFLIVVGVLGNLEKFADTGRYGLAFYTCVFVLTFAGMVVSGVLATLCRVKNYQVRAIAIETGIRNASLAMTIALLLQDRMGDFYSSMFFTAGIFGLWMYAAGVATIFLFPRLLPVTEEELRLHKEMGKSGAAAA